METILAAMASSSIFIQWSKAALSNKYNYKIYSIIEKHKLEEVMVSLTQGNLDII